MEIPKIIHQIWLGSKDMPARFETWQRTWRQHFPGYEVVLWRDQDVARIVQNLRCADLVLNKEWNVGMRSDVLRMELLREYGGIYADCDYECLRPWRRLLQAGCFHYSDESPGQPGNGLMAAPPGHGLAVRLCDDWAAVLPASGFRDYDPVQATGPQRLKAAVDCWVAGSWRQVAPIYDEGHVVGARWPRDLVSFWAEGFAPEHWNGNEPGDYAAHRNAYRPYAYAWHHYSGTWTPEWNGK